MCTAGGPIPIDFQLQLDTCTVSKIIASKGAFTSLFENGSLGLKDNPERLLVPTPSMPASSFGIADSGLG